MNKVVVITGGGSGMGLETARIIGKNGYEVIISGTNIEKLKKAKENLKIDGVNCEICLCDVSKKDDVEKLANFALNFGEIYALVNAAGVAPPAVTDEERVIDVNAMGTLYTNEIFYPIMSSGACIVNISSITAYMIPKFMRPTKIYELAFKNSDKLRKKLTRLTRIFGRRYASLIAYALSKNFVVYYVKKASKKFYKENKVRVLSISPTNFKTPMGNRDAKKNPKSLKRYLSNQAIPISGNPEEIGFLISCLIDPRMGILTAEDIHVDGGWYGYNHGKVRW